MTQQQPDTEQCGERLYKDWHSYQCTRKVWKGTRCKIHHPETVASRLFRIPFRRRLGSAPPHTE